MNQDNLWYVLYKTPDMDSYKTVSTHDTKYEAHRVAMQGMFGLYGVNVVVCYKDEVSFYLGEGNA